MSGLVSGLYTAATGGVALVAGGSVAYLLGLLASAAGARRAAASPPLAAGSEPRLAVVIPAHNEELVIHATLESLAAQAYPADRYEVVVLADNCSDRTAEIARAATVTVIERFDTTERGKGYALAHATAHLLSRPTPPDAVVIVDADTWVAPDFLAVMAAHLVSRADAAGRCALQGRYGVLNADEGWRAALMAGAFDLFNHVKPLGRDRRGLSVGLKGNGMAFTRPVLTAAPFSGRSITEDIDYGLDLLRHHNIRVGYVSGALVRAQMPVSAAQAESQRARWENGRYKLLRERALPLLAEGMKKRDGRLLDAAVDLLVPPLAEIAALLVLWLLLAAVGASAGWLPGGGTWTVAAAVALTGYAVYVLGGFAVSGAPRAAYAALLRAPLYALWKFALLVAKPLRRRKGAANTAAAGADEWVRTERAAIQPPAVAAAAPAEETAAP